MTFTVGQTPQPSEGLVLNSDKQLVLTIRPDQMLDCTECAYVHIVLLTDADVTHIRHFGHALLRWADQLEGVQ